MKLLYLFEFDLMSHYTHSSAIGVWVGDLTMLPAQVGEGAIY